MKYICVLGTVEELTNLLKSVQYSTVQYSTVQYSTVQYRDKRNLCTKLQRHDRTNYYKELFEKMENENDVKKLFRTTKKLLGNTTVSPPDRFLVDGKVITKQKDLAEALATYYDDKVKKIKKTLSQESA